MPDDDPFDPSIIDEISGAAIEYANSYLLPQACDALNIDGAMMRAVRVRSNRYNAQITYDAQSGYTIRLFDGLTHVFRIGFSYIFSDRNSGAFDTFSSLAERMFGDAGHAEILLEISVYLSVNFVIGHEFGHAYCDHFRLLDPAGLREADGTTLGIGEFEQTVLSFGGLPASAALRENAVKLMELEADGVGYRFLTAIADNIVTAMSNLSEMFERSPHTKEVWDRSISNDPFLLYELCLYSAVAATGILETLRGSSNETNQYPLPYTRVTYVFMAYAYLRHEDWIQAGHMLKSVTANKDSDHLTRALINCIDLVEAFCDGLEFPLDEVYRCRAESGVLHDITRKIWPRDNSDGEWHTPAIREFSALEPLFGEMDSLREMLSTENGRDSKWLT